MKDLSLPFDKETAEMLLGTYGSPLYVYDEVGLRMKSRKINSAFSGAKNYKNFFAVKATPTPGILKVLLEEGNGFDCSSRAELVIMKKMGIRGEQIFYTSNNTPKEDFELALELGATINLDDEAQIGVLISACDGRRLDSFAARYNPGELKNGNTIIGVPTEAKYGMDIEALKRVFTKMKTQSVSKFGLHTMVASNELDIGYFAETATILLDAVEEVERACGVKISFINLGGGFGLNYLPDQDEFDVVSAATKIQEVVQKRYPDMTIYTENGRYITGPHGYLLTRSRYIMQKHKEYVGVDASMQNLMRPGMYGAYHHITVMDAEERMPRKYDVVGSLCENNDKFCIDRELPEVLENDILVIHDAGAHGHAMGFNYNGLLRSAEVLLLEGGKSCLIRKAQSIEELLENVIW